MHIDLCFLTSSFQLQCRLKGFETFVPQANHTCSERCSFFEVSVLESCWICGRCSRLLVWLNRSLPVPRPGLTRSSCASTIERCIDVERWVVLSATLTPLLWLVLMAPTFACQGMQRSGGGTTEGGSCVSFDGAMSAIFHPVVICSDSSGSSKSCVSRRCDSYGNREQKTKAIIQ